MKNYTTYLFDLDGTLINTVDLIVKCFHHSLDYAAGLKLTDAEIKKNIGLPLIEQFKVYLSKYPNIDYEDVMKIHMDYQLENYKDYIYAYDGVMPTLDALKKKKKKLAIVTSRRTLTATLYSEKLNIFKYFELLVTPESTTHYKPHPEPALFALKKLNSSPNEALFIGDSSFDMDCGSDAGCDTAFASWGAEHHPFKVPPTYTLNSMTDLLK